jgi:hypothetical protein
MRKLYPLNVIIQEKGIIMCGKEYVHFIYGCFWGFIHTFFFASSLVSVISCEIL